MAYYRTRESSITASDSMTALTSLYGISTSASIQVPQGVSQIVGGVIVLGFVGLVKNLGRTTGDGVDFDKSVFSSSFPIKINSANIISLHTF